jgi:hypothetical protein
VGKYSGLVGGKSVVEGIAKCGSIEGVSDQDRLRGSKAGGQKRECQQEGEVVWGVIRGFHGI